jgi:dipeptidyl aminopeptidase/acylaminoacyl peptidase
MLAGALLLALLACGLIDRAGPTLTPAAPVTLPPAITPALTTSVQPLPSATAPSQETEAPPALPTSGPVVGPSDTPPASGPVLTQNGPWLIYNTAEGLVAANADGSGAVPLGARLAVPTAEIAAAPSGGWAAFMTSASGGSGGLPADAALSIVHLPEAAVSQIAALLSPEIQGQMSGPDRPPEAIVALGEPGALSWSPDGRYLAYLSAAEGPTTDLYVYDTQSGEHTRLTDGPTEVASPFWSPDGRWIVHQLVRTFGSGAGWEVEAVWAAAADGSAVHRLYNTDIYSGGEVFLGWSAPDTFVVYSQGQPADSTQLRLVNVNTGAAQNLYARQFNAAAFDTGSGRAAMIVDAVLAELQNLLPAAYLVTGEEIYEPVQEGEWQDLQWSSGAGRFLAQGGPGVLVFTPAGEAAQFPQEAWGAASPDGQWLAAWGHAGFDPMSGVRIYTLDGQLQAELTTESVDWVLWRPDSLGLFYVSGNGLYYAAWPGGLPQALNSSLQAGREGGLGWVTR